VCDSFNVLAETPFFGAFAKLRKDTISFAMSIRLSVRIHKHGSHWTDCHEVWYLRIFRKSVEKLHVSLKSDKNKRYFTWKPIKFLWYLAHFFLDWEMLQAKPVEKIKTHILYSKTLFFRKSCRVWENMGKILYSSTCHRWQYGACAFHAGYLRLQIHTLSLCNTHCYTTATMFARTRLIVTLSVHCMSYCKFSYNCIL
jgi:hypothetical protein